MGQFFSDNVEKALQYIYYENKGYARHGQKGFQLLTDASAAGDGDATCILARCLSGPQYVWKGFGFPEEPDEKVEALYRLAVEQGSAIGMLVAIRSGVLSVGLERKAPITLQEAFDRVLKNAAGGDAFSQYVIGNSYFWWDFLRIQQKSAEDFPSREAFKVYLKENITQCEDWFWKAFRGGIYLAGNNLYNYYLNGDEDIVAPQPDKAKDIYKIGAEMGYPVHQIICAQNAEQAGQMEESRKWYRKAAENGYPNAWYQVAAWYEKGIGGPADMAEAVYCYKQSAESNETGGLNVLAEYYFYGLNGFPKDPARAFRYCQKAMDLGSTYNRPIMARCYLEGWGTPVDYAEAYVMASKSSSWSNGAESCYVLGRIYCDGLGKPEDIGKGVEFLRQISDHHPEAQEELKKYKKGLFGGWKRR